VHLTNCSDTTDIYLFRKDERDEFTTVYGCDFVSFGLCISLIVEKSDTVLDGYIGVPAVVVVMPRLHEEAGTDVVRADADADGPGCPSLIGGNSSDVDKNGNSTSFCITEHCLLWSRLVASLMRLACLRSNASWSSAGERSGFI